MTSITQTIPNYINGISQQPDELKPPGYVTVAKNVLPDVTEGLVKRPGSKLMNTITPLNGSSTWFDYYRDENEHYIGQIKNETGVVKIWNCKDGTEKTVTSTISDTMYFGQHYSRDSSGVMTITAKESTENGSGSNREHGLTVGEIIWSLSEYQVIEVVSPTQFKVQSTTYSTGSSQTFFYKASYLMAQEGELQTLTLNDYTYICNRAKPVKLDSATTPAKPFEAYIDLKKVAYARQYGINLFDDTTTDQTIKTATRVKVASSSLDDESTCPNVGTEIFKVGTDNQDLTTSKQKFKFSKVTIGQGDNQNFIDKNDDRTYSLVYVPPAWTTDTYYQTGDLVQGDTNNSRIYKRTGAAYTSSGTVPVHDANEVDGWTALTTTNYAANADVSSTQLYNGQACIEVSTASTTINSEETLDTAVNTWASGNGAHFPFEIDSTDWYSVGGEDEIATLNYVWKHDGDYSDHLSRIILRRTSGTLYTIGGNNVFSATDGALKTDHGKIELSRFGWGGNDVLPAGKSGLYFRLTTTGQAIPNTDATSYTCRYTTTIDLLHGGTGWEAGDKIQVRMKDGVHVIQVEEISTGKVQANLGLIRPNPTSFDAKTTVTSDSIIGDIRQAIIDSQTVTYAQNNGSGSAGVRVTITKTAHNLTTGDKVDVEFLTKSGGNIPDNETAKAITVSNANTFYFNTAAGNEDITGTCIVDFTSANIKQIGSGLYLKRPSRFFKISTPATDILNVMTTEVDDVADLPKQCKHGYVVKVRNSESDKDDYYVKFIGSLIIKSWIAIRLYSVGDEVVNCGKKYVCTQSGISGSSGGPTGTGNNIVDNGAKWDYAELNDDTDYLNGDGTWEECLAPEQQFKFDVNTMPHQLVRKADGNFDLKPIPIAAESLDDNLPQWEDAKVGKTGVDGTNPQPSFVGKTINNMLFWRNRLIMLSDENVIMSKPGDFFNFWYKSAIAFSDIDPIDISCSSEYPAIVYAGIQTNAGLVLFTKNQQFLVGTDTDVLSTTTAKINSLSSYNFNHSTNPFSLGTTIGFLDNAGKYNRLWEMSTVLREGQPTVVEQSKSVNELIDTNLNLVANSRENQVAFFSKRDSNKIFGFKYHTVGQKRIQQAWVTWEVHGEIQHMAMFDDALFLIIKDKDVYSIQRIALTTLSDSIEITDDRGTTSDTSDDFNYRVYLDNGTIIPASSLGYSSSTGKTGFTIPTNFDATSANKLAVFCHSAGDDNGRYTDQVTIAGTGANANIEITGDWTGQDLTVGYLYDMEVQLPTIYVQQAAGESFKSEIHKSLVIHRIKLSLGSSGLYTTTLARPGKTDFTKTHESPLADQYNASRVSVNNVLKETVPVYEKNTNLTFTIKSTHPTPATLYSMAWEGDYTNKFYQNI